MTDAAGAAARQTFLRGDWHLVRSSTGPDERAASLLEEAGYRLVARGDTVGAVTALTNASVLSPADSERARRLAAAAYVGARLGGGIALAGDTLREVRRQARSRLPGERRHRSEERRVGKEYRSRWSRYKRE